MSITLAISAHAPKSKQGFEVEYRESCAIMRGAISVDMFVALTKTMPKGAVVSTDLATRFGATFVAGLPDDLDRLAKIAPPRPLPPESDKLPADAIQWLREGERGASSEAMFDAAFAGQFAASHDGASATPGDVSDFMRCRLMFERVGYVAAHLDRVAQLSPIWSRIVEAWPQLCDSLDREVADYRTGWTAAPQTQALLESLHWPTSP